ncbi:MAG: 4Fe-4S dicluster domain-containing protein, partial [Burkholderiales bacterium]|nr:4Fe-4S dicluster domain-containing protein [Burkholderiales bacterium]
MSTPAQTPRWGMVVDLNRCVGCQTCTAACKHANDTPPGVQWRRVLDVETGSFPDVERLFLVTGCQHCAEPPCVPVCPTGATSQRADGLVVQDYDVCIGCGYCAVACPYQARTIVHEQRWYYGRETAQERAVEHGERLGVAQKCTFCKERVDDGLARGLKPGVHPEATPACAAACIAQAIHFGDFNDPASNVSGLTREQPYLKLNADLGTDPQIRYLYTTPAVPGRAADAADEERLSDPANPLNGALQQFWDWRAAMNWIFGGTSSGMAVAAWLASAGGAVPAGAVPALHAAAAGLMALGLFFVFLKIGRKLRFWRAISRPQSSWMTREIYVVAAFYPVVLANLVAPRSWLAPAGGVLALAFLVCQAMILYRARGIPAWRAPLVPWMIVATGLLEGVGLLALLLAGLAGSGAMAPGLPLAALVLVALNATLWIAYRAAAREQGIRPLSRQVIARMSLPLHAIGHALAAALFLLALVDPALLPACTLAGAVAAIAGGAYLKYMLVVHAGFHQGFALPMLPQRGSGVYAAPV